MEWYVIVQMEDGKAVKVKVSASSKGAAEWRAERKARAQQGQPVECVLSSRRA